FGFIRLKRPYEKVSQKIAEKSPKSKAVRISPISCSVGSVAVILTRTMVTTGHVRLSRPRNSVTHAQMAAIVEPCQMRNPATRSPDTTASASGISSQMSRSEEHMSELQSRFDLVCRLLLEK